MMTNLATRTPDELSVGRAWHRKLHDAAGVHSLAKEYGGRGATLLSANRIQPGTGPGQRRPPTVNFPGIARVGPTLMQWEPRNRRSVTYRKSPLPKRSGARDSQSRIMAPISRRSRLARSMKATTSPSTLQVWTSNAHHADFSTCCAEPTRLAPKHKGLSYLLVDMKSPGVTVRRLCK